MSFAPPLSPSACDSAALAHLERTGPFLYGRELAGLIEFPQSVLESLLKGERLDETALLRTFEWMERSVRTKYVPMPLATAFWDMLCDRCANASPSAAPGLVRHLVRLAFVREYLETVQDRVRPYYDRNIFPVLGYRSGGYVESTLFSCIAASAFDTLEKRPEMDAKIDAIVADLRKDPSGGDLPKNIRAIVKGLWRHEGTRVRNGHDLGAGGSSEAVFSGTPYEDALKKFSNGDEVLRSRPFGVVSDPAADLAHLRLLVRSSDRVADSLGAFRKNGSAAPTDLADLVYRHCYAEAFSDPDRAIPVGSLRQARGMYEKILPTAKTLDAPIGEGIARGLSVIVSVLDSRKRGDDGSPFSDQPSEMSFYPEDSYAAKPWQSFRTTVRDTRNSDGFPKFGKDEFFLIPPNSVLYRHTLELCVAALVMRSVPDPGRSLKRAEFWAAPRPTLSGIANKIQNYCKERSSHHPMIGVIRDILTENPGAFDPAGTYAGYLAAVRGRFQRIGFDH